MLENINYGNEIYSKSTEDVKSAKKTSKKSDYGKTIGTPTLSEEGQKYYEELKKKYGNMDFILVSSDMKEQAKSQAGQYANPSKMVVLIDEDKIEKMATDEQYRKQYEGIISNAGSGLSSMKQSLASSGANVKGFGMQVNDQGTVSYFAVLKDSSAAQKKRIEKAAAQKKEKQKAADKLEQKKKAQDAKDDKKVSDDDTITITANSMEELLQKINDYTMSNMSDNVQTKEEQMIGQHIDFKG